MVLVVMLGALPATAFEGEIVTTVQGAGQTVQMTATVSKAGALRLDSPGMSVVVLPSGAGDSPTILQLSHKDRRFIKIKAPPRPDLSTLADALKARMNVETLGEETYLNRKVKHVRITDSQTKEIVEMWLDPSLDEVNVQLLKAGVGGDPKLRAILKSRGVVGYPLKVVQTAPNGSVMRMTVDTVREFKASPALFVAPRDYQEMQLPVPSGAMAAPQVKR